MQNAAKLGMMSGSFFVKFFPLVHVIITTMINLLIPTELIQLSHKCQKLLSTPLKNNQLDFTMKKVKIIGDVYIYLMGRLLLNILLYVF